MRSTHGQTPAGWVSVTIMLVGSVIGAFGIGSGKLWLTLTGTAVFLAGILAAKLLQMAGYGQYPARRSSHYATAEAYLGAQRAEDPRMRRDDADRDVPAAH